MRTVSKALAVLACLLSFASDGSASEVCATPREPARADLVHSPVDSSPAPTPVVLSQDLEGIDEEDNDELEGPLPVSPAFVSDGTGLAAIPSQRLERHRRSNRAPASHAVLRC